MCVYLGKALDSNAYERVLVFSLSSGHPCFLLSLELCMSIFASNMVVSWIYSSVDCRYTSAYRRETDAPLCPHTRDARPLQLNRSPDYPMMHSTWRQVCNDADYCTASNSRHVKAIPGIHPSLLCNQGGGEGKP